MIDLHTAHCAFGYCALRWLRWIGKTIDPGTLAYPLVRSTVSEDFRGKLTMKERLLFFAFVIPLTLLAGCNRDSAVNKSGHAASNNQAGSKAIKLTSPDDAAEAKEAANLEKAVDRVVLKLKGGDKDATEYRKARRYHKIEFGNPISPHIVALFTIENFGGGNNYQFYMALLKYNGIDFSEVDATKIGGGGIRQIDFEKVSVRNNQIVIGTREYLRDDKNFDPNCCPSLIGEAFFELTNGKLQEDVLKKPEPSSLS